MRDSPVSTVSPSRVLVCDDERHILRLLQVNLERQGHLVDCAAGGNEAIKLLDESKRVGSPKYNRVILDADMPHVDGYEVLAWIRTHLETRDLWVALMISTELREEWQSRPHRAELYVTKPFNPTDIF